MFDKINLKELTDTSETSGIRIAGDGYDRRVMKLAIKNLMETFPETDFSLLSKVVSADKGSIMLSREKVVNGDYITEQLAVVPEIQKGCYGDKVWIWKTLNNDYVKIVGKVGKDSEMESYTLLFEVDESERFYKLVHACFISAMFE